MFPVPVTKVDTPDGPLFVARDVTDASVYDANGEFVGVVCETAGPQGGTVWEYSRGNDPWFSGDYQRTRKAAVAGLASLLKAVA